MTPPRGAVAVDTLPVILKLPPDPGLWDSAGAGHVLPAIWHHIIIMIVDLGIFHKGTTSK